MIVPARSAVVIDKSDLTIGRGKEIQCKAQVIRGGPADKNIVHNRGGNIGRWNAIQIENPVWAIIHYIIRKRKPG
jgi:hypothetical protein